MIYGIGTDIVLTERIATIYSRRPEHFAAKLLSSSEIQNFNNLVTLQKKVLYLTNRWIAKEAVVKALGTGFRAGLYLSEISILNNELGKPQVVLSQLAQTKVVELLQNQHLTTNFAIHLSLSHEVNYATSMAIVELI